jgi:hypothetical protein
MKKRTAGCDSVLGGSRGFACFGCEEDVAATGYFKSAVYAKILGRDENLRRCSMVKFKIESNFLKKQGPIRWAGAVRMRF